MDATASGTHPTRLQIAEELIAKHVSSHLVSGKNLKHGVDFQDEDQIVYCGYPVPSRAVAAATQRLAERKKIPVMKANSLLLQTLEGKFEAELPNAGVERISTYIPKSLSSNEAYKGSEICHVYTVACAKEINNDLVDQEVSSKVGEILRRYFNQTSWRAEKPRWFFGGHDYVEDNEPDHYPVERLQISVDRVIKDGPPLNSGNVETSQQSQQEEEPKDSA